MLFFVLTCIYIGQIEGNIGILYTSPAFPPVSARRPSHSQPSSYPLLIFMPVYVSLVSHASAPRIGRGEWSCSVAVYGIERIFWIVRSRRSFRPSGIPQARAKGIDDRTYYAIAEYDLGYRVSFETTAVDDVIPRSWTMPYTASAFCVFFQKLFKPRTAKEKKNELTRYSLYLLALSGWTGRVCECGIDGDRM